MKNLNIKTGLLLLIFAMVSGTVARAADIDFNFEVPHMPYPPKIEDMAHSSAVPDGVSFQATARVTAQTQMKGFCDVVPKEDCTNADWYQMPDPGITPNPPAIQKVTLYYYKNDGITSTSVVDMAYDAALGRYKADVPLAGTVAGDTITFYITAIDSMGNVASQTPDTSQRPCPSTSSWDATLATPATSSCAYATSYTQCNEYVSGTPGPCSTTYTMNDKNGDVCGEPGIGVCGNEQCVISGAAADKVDLLGVSAGADDTYVCANLGLRAPTPTASDPAPIETYLLTFYNPDVYDPNPGDTHIENALAITYAPEAVGSDPTLVKVIWSGDCVTDPDTSNPLDCKLISTVGFNDDLKIEYGGGSLKFMVKKSGTGNPYAVPFNIFGNPEKLTVLAAQTGEINLSGGTAFWESDRTPGFAFYHTNTTVNIEPGTTPAAPIITSTLCSEDGTGGTSKTCGKESPMPTQNVCAITFSPVSLDKTFTTEYRVYRNTNSGTTGAAQIGSVAETNAASYTYPDTHTQLDGRTYYYFLTAYNAAADKETALSNAAKTSCTLMDGPHPEGPVITSAATPPGNEKKCRITWDMPVPDPSLSRFYVSRSDDGGATFNVRNLVSPVAANPDSLNYEWSDPAVLELGRTYKYKVTAVDLGDNTVESTPVNCVPSDLKSPWRIPSAVVCPNCEPTGVRASWSESAEEDLAGYNIYYCDLYNLATDCRSSNSFVKLNDALVTEVEYNANTDTHPGMIHIEDNCVYVEACDNCNVAGTCPENGGAPNCSGFPPGGADSTLYVKCSNCLDCCSGFDTNPPAFPANVSCASPPEGEKVEITWNHICHDANGAPFNSYDPVTGNCPNPDANELVGYKVIFGDRGAVPIYQDATSSDIAGAVAVGTNSELIHNNLTNGAEYCYTVYGLDGAGSFSQDSIQYPKTEVCCTPADTLPPANPEIIDMEWNSISCTPEWGAVSDPDTITYSVYRCQDSEDACGAPGDFSLIQSGINQGDVSYTDFDVAIDNEYRYCITAGDSSGNESAVIEPDGGENCAMCSVTDPPPPYVVRGVAAYAQPGLFPSGIKLFWEDNSSGGGGYNVYRCAVDDCGDAAAPILSCDPGNRTLASPLLIDDEPSGDWYYGVTYTPVCGNPAFFESPLWTTYASAVAGPVHIEPAPCANCVLVSSCADYESQTSCIPIQTVDTSLRDTDGKFLSVGVSGYQVQLLDMDNNIIASTFTDIGGNYLLVAGNDSGGINLANLYKVVLIVPAADKQGVPCSPGFAGDDCYIVLNGSVRVTDDGVTQKISGLSLPAPGGGRAEAGNADCSDSIDVGDLLILKAAFGANYGDSTYQPYADFDGNGRIDVEDFLIFKKNFGKTLDAAPVFVDGLCKP